MQMLSFPAKPLPSSAAFAFLPAPPPQASRCGTLTSGYGGVAVVCGGANQARLPLHDVVLCYAGTGSDVPKPEDGYWIRYEEDMAAFKASRPMVLIWQTDMIKGTAIYSNAFYASGFMFQIQQLLKATKDHAYPMEEKQYQAILCAAQNLSLLMDQSSQGYVTDDVLRKATDSLMAFIPPEVQKHPVLAYIPVPAAQEEKGPYFAKLITKMEDVSLYVQWAIMDKISVHRFGVHCKVSFSFD